MGDENKQVTGRPGETDNEARSHVLVVDDDDMVRDMAAQLIERLGFKVLKAPGGREALEMFMVHHEQIHTVIVDFSMPNLTGMDVFLEMQKLDRRARIFIMSGFGENENMEKCRENGLAGFLPKPFTKKDLQKILGTAQNP